MSRRLLFLHGADGFDDDRSIAEGLESALEAPVDMPRLPEDKSFGAWATAIRTHLSRLSADDLLVAHSFGASILLRVLAAADGPRRVVLLAMPDWGPDGWDVPEYAFTGPVPRGVDLSMHHCLDDEVVPAGHLDLNAALLPDAQLHRHRIGGRQFVGLAEAIAADAAKPWRGEALGRRRAMDST
ncbi:alpha/beta hydrolase [Gordonia aurantiaca]|uniref:alpha/beta hydrolase n=1 Tax=Gordonia sp. B21 TaxID=3151852 RepID=UPI003263D1FE